MPERSPVPESNGTFAFSAISLAECFKPKRLICLESGPMNLILFSSHLDANRVFSLKKP